MKAGDDLSDRSGAFGGEHAADTPQQRQEQPCEEGCLDPLERAKQEFNKNRKIIVTSAPLMTHDEAKEFLADFECRNIIVNKKLRQVVATLKDASDADDAVAKLNRKMFRGAEVTVRIHPLNKLLCVAQLPLQMIERDFHELVKTYGEIERCFLMHSKSGASKGYGFVEFACDRQESEVIRCKLERKSLDDSLLHCDFIKETITDFDQLNSSCLYVGNLPLEFDDDSHLREVFSVVAEPLFCRVARKDDNPVGFAVVEYTRPEHAEETFNKVQDRQIGGQTIDIKYCIPGHMAPEAFNRHLRFLDGSDEVEIIPKVLPVPSLCSVSHPPPVCSVLVNLLEKYPAVLKDFKQLLLHLQRHLNQEQRQLLSDKPGLLGEAPNVNGPLNNPGIQFSILAVMLGHQLQQSLPNAMSNSAILSLLPPGFNIQLMCASSGITQAMFLIQAICKDDDEDDDDDEGDKNDDDKEAQEVFENVRTEEEKEKEKEKSPAASEAEIRPLMSVSPLMSNANLLTDLDALLAFVQTNHKSKLKHPFANPKNPPKTSDAGTQPADAREDSTPEAQQSILGEAPGQKAGLLGAPPSLLAQPVVLNQLNAVTVNPLLGSTIERLIQRHIFMGPSKSAQTPVTSSSSQPVVNLMDVPVVQPLLGKTVPPVTKGDGLMGPRPSVPVGLMSVKLGLERPGAGLLGDGIMGSGPGTGLLGDGIMGSGPGAGLLGSRPFASDGLLGSKPWDLMEMKSKQMQSITNISNPGVGVLGGSGGGVGGIGFGGGGGAGGGISGGGSSSGGVGEGFSVGSGGNIRFGGAGGNERQFSGSGGKFVGSSIRGGSVGEMGPVGNTGGFGTAGEFGRVDVGGKGSHGSGGAWESPDSMPLESGKSWGGNNYGDGRDGGKNRDLIAWDAGRSQSMDQRNWEGGMQNQKWDNQRGYQEWNSGMAWGGGGGSNDNRGSWNGSQQSSQGFVQGQKQGPQPLMGEASAPFGAQAGGQSYDSYYTENKGTDWNDQYKGFGGSEQAYYGGNWSGMNTGNKQPTGLGQSATANVATNFGKSVGPQSQGYATGGEGMSGYGSFGNHPNTGGNQNAVETGYKAGGSAGVGESAFSYGSSVPGNTGNNSSSTTGDMSSTSGGWDQNMYNQYMQQYMQQYGNFPNAATRGGENSGVSTGGNASALTGFGMDSYSSASTVASGQQTFSSFPGQGQYSQSQGQGQYNQGHYGQSQGQYGQSQGQYSQDPGQYGQGQGQYGLGQGQYGLGQGQYGQDQYGMKRPFPEESNNFQYSQPYGSGSKKNRPSDFGM